MRHARQTVVEGVMLRGLYDASLLQGPNHPVQIPRRGVRPAVHGVDVHPQQGEQQKLPTEQTQQGASGKDPQRDERRHPHRLP